MKINSGHKWIMVILALLAFNVIGTVTLIIVANDSAHSKVLPSYRFEAK